MIANGSKCLGTEKRRNYHFPEQMKASTAFAITAIFKQIWLMVKRKCQSAICPT